MDRTKERGPFDPRSSAMLRDKQLTAHRAASG
jgi:hypothetical protein